MTKDIVAKDVVLTAAVYKAAEADRDSESADLARAAAAALQMMADAIRNGDDHDQVIEELKAARVNEALADVLDVASDAAMDALDDPYEFDGRLIADNLGGAASTLRSAFKWL
ncbi:hypothetical protein QIS99_28695 [Streptomyces sp. B-S-A8]|uniref:Uncharacterized protein n=1 Tax=Streptomyces solicavernae TaxID=3043614 RepID=A0ABT6S0B5_9ACTN|nr:hypothetical protein [Streptomyces sp. B-S-A8]MDI3390139.1 hypothetical protein [Streptomyces sp. B-S-A8]